MYKRIIFDVDGTLIDKFDLTDAINSSLSKFGISATKEQLELYKNAMFSYEEYFFNYDLYCYLYHMRRISGIDIPIESIEYFLDDYSKLTPNPIPNYVYDTLEYLRSKYDLIVLTNFFRKTQLGRLKELKLSEYFSEVIGGEEYMKPDIRAFNRASGPFDNSDCLMIGDSIDIDYKGAINSGMHAYLISKSSIPDVRTINSIKKLKKIL